MMNACIPALLMSVALSAQAEPWSENQNPKRWDQNYSQNYAQFPVSVELPKNEIPWTTTYWADHEGGISHRWAMRTPDDFTYTSPTLERLRNMILSEKNKLSPAEKWDILNSHYDYPTVASEWTRTNPKQVSWAGICHGWSLAALSFHEPQNQTVKNAEGIEVTLNSTDLKALASLAVAKQANEDSILIGTNCDRGGRQNPTNLGVPQCAGVNAGAFHIILANSLGLQKKPFVANVSRDEQIWNHPVYGYDTQTISERGPSGRSSPETVREIKVTTYLYTVEMQDPLTPDPVQGTEAQPLGSMKYTYWLELNAKGDIVGGQWETFGHPGFIWKNKSRVGALSGQFSGLEKLLRPI